jgi:hypothetical protein
MRFCRPFFVFLAVAGCRFLTDSDDALTVAITSDRSTISAEDSAQLRVTLTNRSSRAVEVNLPCPHYFVVSDPSGREAGPPRLLCALILLPPTRLASGESLTLADTWAADSGDGSSGRTVRVAPGTYQLRGVLFGQHRAVTSPPITVVVTP